LKEFLRSLEAVGLLNVVKEKISTDLEISAVLGQYQTQAFLFQNIENSSLGLAGNLYSSRRNIELGLKMPDGKLVEALEEVLKHPAESIGEVSNFEKSDWSVNSPADLSKLPILKHFGGEAGPYMTAGIVVAQFPGKNEENLSFHRMLVLSENKAAARVVPRHLNQIGKETGKGKVPISVLIGPPPSVFVAASLQTNYQLSEYKIAKRLSGNEGLRLTRSELSGNAVPLDTEIVLEGYIDFNDLVDEGPFVDLTGTYDDVRKQPVVTFERMHMKREPVYQAVLASSIEHSIFMGLPQELKIREALAKSTPGFRAVHLTPSSGGYFHCVVSLEKSNDGDGKTAILNCFAASHPLKLVVAVDADVDPSDPRQVEWALATRFQANRGLVQINGARGSSLDPSSGKLGVTSKIGFDATIPMSDEKRKYTRAKQGEISRDLGQAVKMGNSSLRSTS
jgi:UbiD family decarboxylase